jgi:hypothetical protein
MDGESAELQEGGDPSIPRLPTYHLGKWISFLQLRYQ